MTEKPHLTSFVQVTERVEESWLCYQADTSNALMRDSLLHRFKIAYEMACKVLKRYLQYASAEPGQFRQMGFQDVIRTANQQGLLLGGLSDWLFFRDMRGRTSYAYEDEVALEIAKNTPRFLKEATYLRDRLLERLELVDVAEPDELSRPTTRNKDYGVIDLSADHLAFVREVLQRHVPEREVLVFGSRVQGTAREYSDLDLAIQGDAPLPLNVVLDMTASFRDSDFPLKVDVVDLASVDESFRDIILRDGIAIQPPSETPSSE